jgi:hypothetical protein
MTPSSRTIRTILGSAYVAVFETRKITLKTRERIGSAPANLIGTAMTLQGAARTPPRYMRATAITPAYAPPPKVAGGFAIAFERQAGIE